MKVIIIIPTYNEKANIANTIDGLETAFKKIPAKHQMNILVIDDNSPDGTADIVKKKAKQYGNIILFPNKEKKGLGAAYIKAMKYAITKLKADVVFEYDADGSHQPKYIPGMVKTLETKADVVVGSRYIPGGSMPDDWGIHRKLVSYVGNLIARVVLFTPQFKDMTTGFRGTKTKFLKKVDLDNLISKQFAYKIQLYYELHRLGAKVVEYPIAFIDRSKGKSKFPRNNIIDSLRVVFKLRLRDSQQFIKFGIVGFIGFIVNAVALEAFYRLGLKAREAAALGAELAIISNFTFNNIWTFAHKKITSWKRLPKKFIQFNFASIGAVLIQYIVVGLGVYFFGDGVRFIFFVVAVAIGLLVNYTIYTRWIWKTHKK